MAGPELFVIAEFDCKYNYQIKPFILTYKNQALSNLTFANSYFNLVSCKMPNLQVSIYPIIIILLLNFKSVKYKRPSLLKRMKN